jgi:hypothetical protein
MNRTSLVAVSLLFCSVAFAVDTPSTSPDEVTQLRAENHVLRAEVKMLKDQLDKTKSELQNAKSRLAEAQEEIAMLKTTVEQAKPPAQQPGPKVVPTAQGQEQQKQYTIEEFPITEKRVSEMVGQRLYGVGRVWSIEPIADKKGRYQIMVMMRFRGGEEYPGGAESKAVKLDKSVPPRPGTTDRVVYYQCAVMFVLNFSEDTSLHLYKDQKLSIVGDIEKIEIIKNLRISGYRDQDLFEIDSFKKEKGWYDQLFQVHLLNVKAK